jgi:hypothetical protein
LFGAKLQKKMKLRANKYKFSDKIV